MKKNDFNENINVFISSVIKYPNHSLLVSDINSFLDDFSYDDHSFYSDRTTFTVLRCSKEINKYDYNYSLIFKDDFCDLFFILNRKDSKLSSLCRYTILDNRIRREYYDKTQGFIYDNKEELELSTKKLTSLKLSCGSDSKE